MEYLWYSAASAFFVFVYRVDSHCFRYFRTFWKDTVVCLASTFWWKKENGNAWYNSAGDLDSDASWCGPYVESQQELELWPEWWSGDHFSNPAYSGVAWPRMRELTFDSSETLCSV